MNPDVLNVAIEYFTNELEAPTLLQEFIQFIIEKFYLAEFAQVFGSYIVSTHYLYPKDRQVEY